MTTQEKCGVAMLAYAFIDPSIQEGVDAFNDVLFSLSLSFEDFKVFIKQLPKSQIARYIVYDDLRNLSSKDKGLVRSVLFNAYSKGGKQGSAESVFYFKEMIEECDLANAHIQL